MILCIHRVILVLMVEMEFQVMLVLRVPLEILVLLDHSAFLGLLEQEESVDQLAPEELLEMTVAQDLEDLLVRVTKKGLHDENKSNSKSL